MSVIQNIRDKYIGLVVGAIIVALVGFLVMDAMQSNVRNIFSGDKGLLASINGTRIEYKDFESKRSQYEDNMKSRSKDGTLTEQERNSVQEQAWSDIVNETLIGEELEKLGMTEIGDKELQDMLTGPYADPLVQQSFKNPDTGIFDPSIVSQNIAAIDQDKTGQQKILWKNFEEQLIRNRKQSKYTDLISKGIYIPKFMMDDASKQQTAKSSINFVSLPYTMIGDNEVKVTDEDVKKYIDKHEEMFKSQEATAKTEYVAFDIIPSSDDTAASLGVLNGLKDTFTKTTDNEAFVSKNSEDVIRDMYYTEKTLVAPNPAEIVATEIGAVTGPFYIDQMFKMVKVIDKKSMPDSVKVSRVVVAFTEQRKEEDAKASIDSMEKMVLAGMDIAQLAATRSDDKASAKKGGDIGYITQEMAASDIEFKNACFNGKVGDVKVIKSEYGYQLIKITDQKNFQPSVKLAIVSKELQAGNPTIQAAFAKANTFIAKAKDAKSFTDAAKSMGKDKRVADNMTKSQQQIPGLGSARDLSRWAFEAKIGAVSPIYNLENKCVIALLVGRQEKGTLPSIETVKPQIENILKKDKKAEALIAKAKGKTTLDELAALGATTVKTADTVLMMGGGNSEIGYEPKVIGASFNKALINKVSPPIQGDQGVFFITVKSMIDGVAADPKNMMYEMQKAQLQQNTSGQAAQIVPYVLKKKAKIEDNRATFF